MAFKTVLLIVAGVLFFTINEAIARSDEQFYVCGSPTFRIAMSSVFCEEIARIPSEAWGNRPDYRWYVGKNLKIHSSGSIIGWHRTYHPKNFLPGKNYKKIAGPLMPYRPL